MANTKKPAKAKPIVDVAHPNDTPPSPNSKSVIMGNHALLKDPMVVAADNSAADLAAGGGPSEANLAKVSNKSSLKPLTAPLLEEAEPAPDEEKPEADVSPAANDPQPPEPDNEPPEPNEPVEPAEPTEPAEPDKPADQPAEPKADGPDQESDTKEDTDSKEASAKQAEADKLAEHQAAIEKLVDSKEYYLPINAVEKRRSKRFVVLGILLSLLLIVAWADIALDAGLVRIGNIKPLTHFFSN